MKKKKNALKGSYTLEMTLLLPIILGVLTISILGAFEFYTKCEKASQIPKEIEKLETAEKFRQIQGIKKTVDKWKGQ